MVTQTSGFDYFSEDFHCRLPKNLSLRLETIAQQNSLRKSQLVRLIISNHLKDYVPIHYRKEITNVD